MKRKTRTSFNHQLTFGPPLKRGRWIFPTLTVALVAGGLTYGLSVEEPWRANKATPASTAATSQAEPALAAPAPIAPPVKKVDIEYVVKPNDTLGQIFSQLKIDVTELPAILALPGVRDRFASLKPGDKLTLGLENGALHGLGRRLSDTEVLSIKRGNNGFAAKVMTTPIEVKTAQVRGTINSSLFAGGRAVGLTPDIVQQLANDIFGWDIDFAHDVRPGDRFNVVYEQKYRDDEYIGDGRIIAAEFLIDGEIHRAVRYKSSDGKIDDYFTPDGRALRRQFLRTPIDFTRVSVNSNPQRRQPIITTLREHQGIDYAAPAGTAIKAAADGVIRFAGANGEYGNVVIVEHGASTSTLYAHMSTFARGMQTNQRVKQGDVIGYVGNTGAATAPHLHYEYRVRGNHTDPSRVELPAAALIPAEYLAEFRSRSAALLTGLEGPGEAIVTASLADAH